MNSYSSEQLSKISREDLRKEFLSVRAAIYRAKKNKNSSIDLEVYYCYVTRELDYREKFKNKYHKLV